MEMLTFAPDDRSKTPLYLQLYEWVKDEIRAGRIEPGSKLPSKRKLAEHLALSLNTIQSAYDQLMEEGFIYSVQRKGYYVSRIDHLVILDTKKKRPATEKRETESSVRYDFSYQGVDPHTFPFVAWRKLTREAIDEYDDELLQAGDPQGHIDLRTALASYLYQSRGVTCTPDQVVISSGIEFLFQILVQMLDSESVYGVENPGYEKLHLLFTTNRARVRLLPIDADGIRMDALRNSDVTVPCITPAHQFPSGEIMPVNRRFHLLHWANEAPERYIVEDDYDSEFKYSGRPIPALQGIDHNEKVIYIGAFSKSLSPAHRISYMVLPEHLVRVFNERVPFLICPVPVLNQKVLSAFMEQGYFERHLNRMRNVYKRKREVLVQSIQRADIPATLSGADIGLHMLLHVENGLSEEELVARALEAGVRVYGISRYFSDRSDLPDTPQIVIGFAQLPERDIRLAVQALERAWRLE